MTRFKFPSYWMLNESCLYCKSPVGRLVGYLSSDKKYVVRIVQANCTHITDQSKYREVTKEDVDEYLKRYAIGEESQ